MKISVALCTYNGETFLKQQIDSILNQTLKVDEIVVCDDGSIDETVSILEKYKDRNPTLFKIYINKVNLRSVKNFEKAIDLCTGEIIFLSDQDDIWIENKVEKYVEYFNENINIDVIASNGYCIDENNKVHEKYSIWDVPNFLEERKVQFEYFKIISYLGNIATGASMAMRKNCILQMLPFPNIKGVHHDEWIAILSSFDNKFILLNNKYFYYRIHNNQQVGGVFYTKDEKSKKDLTEIFNYKNDKISLKIYKRRLKRLCCSFKKNEKLKQISVKSVKFGDICIDIEKLFLKTKLNFKKKQPFLYNFISLTDKILKKRILK